MRQPQQDRSKESARRILESALSLVAEGGLAAVTVAAVAERSQTSNGSIYHLYGNRHSLLLAAQRVFLQRMAMTIDAALEDAARQPVGPAATAAVVNGYIDAFEANARLVRGFLMEGSSDLALRAQGEQVGYLIEAKVSKTLQSVTKCSSRSASLGVYMILSVSTMHMLFGESLFMRLPPSRKALVDYVNKALWGSVVG